MPYPRARLPLARSRTTGILLLVSAVTFGPGATATADPSPAEPAYGDPASSYSEPVPSEPVPSEPVPSEPVPSEPETDLTPEAALAAGYAAARDVVDDSFAQAASADHRRSPWPASRLGVYTRPGAKGIRGAAEFGDWAGGRVSQILDFTPTTSWQQISDPHWVLNPHQDERTRLELSVPMLPDHWWASLAGCAHGHYDLFWSKLARELRSRGMEDVVIRPGWEFNGTWFRWSAVGQPHNYIACFRRIVDVMRAGDPSDFLFDWNPGNGRQAMPAERAYPGDAYVDVIGVDVFDMDWRHYPVKHPGDPAAVRAARDAVWHTLLNGDHGLTFWSAFARARGKPMALTEWGVTWRADGRGGGDNPAFVDRIANFVADPRNRVAYAHYFEIDVPQTEHALSSPGTRFPLAAQRFRARIDDLASRPTRTSALSPAAGAASVP